MFRLVMTRSRLRRVVLRLLIWYRTRFLILLLTLLNTIPVVRVGRLFISRPLLRVAWCRLPARRRPIFRRVKSLVACRHPTRVPRRCRVVMLFRRRLVRLVRFIVPFRRVPWVRRRLFVMARRARRLFRLPLIVRTMASLRLGVGRRAPLPLRRFPRLR